MPIELREENAGRLLVVALTGTLVKQDYASLIAEFRRLTVRYGKIRVLLDMTRFHGWDAGAFWEEIKFDVQHMNDMERLAVVGETRWQQAIAEFAKPFTPAIIRYFDVSEAAQARQWIDEP